MRSVAPAQRRVGACRIARHVFEEGAYRFAREPAQDVRRRAFEDAMVERNIDRRFGCFAGGLPVAAAGVTPSLSARGARPGLPGSGFGQMVVHAGGQAHFDIGRLCWRSWR